MLQIQGLIFDMDGVLLDSEPLHLQAYQELLQTFGITFTEDDNHPFLGRTDLELAEHLICKHQLSMDAWQLVARKEENLARLFSTSIEPMPGVLNVLKKARELSLPCAVASSATLPTIELIVEKLDIAAYFQTLTSGDEVPHGKPAPDVYLLAAKRIGVLPINCLVVEDSFNGVLAAKAAGMKCIAIPCPTTRHQDHTKADKILGTLESLNLDDWLKPASDNSE
ncbi:MAG: HAD family phosphatase [Candidatus Melainabacteria bacterium]|nr:MAG: HAD family phosphatase [Candidatus Melainabacteria bacterium]